MRLSLLEINIDYYCRREIINVKGRPEERLKILCPASFTIDILTIKKADIKNPYECIEKSFFSIGQKGGRFHIDLFWILNDLIYKKKR